MNDPLYNHEVFGPLKGRGGDIGGKTDEELVRDLINIHNAENWLGIDGDCELSLFKTMKADSDDGLGSLNGKGMYSTRASWAMAQTNRFKRFWMQYLFQFGKIASIFFCYRVHLSIVCALTMNMPQCSYAHR